VTAAKAAQTGSTTGGQTFTLTTGTDSLTGSTGNDTFVATNTATAATLGAFDVINGGDGTDTLALNDVNAVTALTGTINSIEKLVVKSASSVGAIGSGATAGAKGVDTLSFAVAPGAGEKYTVVINGVTYTSNAVATADAAGAAGAVAAVINAVLGAGTATVFNGTVIVSGSAVGAAMPVISATGVTDPTSVAAVSNTVVPAAAAAAVTAATFDATGKGFTSLDVTAAGASDIKADATTKVAVNNTVGTTKVTGGTDVTIKSAGAVTAATVKGATDVTVTKVSTGATSVTGGSTVKVTAAGSALDTQGQATGVAASGSITVGAAPAAINDPASATGYPQVIQDLAKDATGDVTIKYSTDYKTLAGQASSVYGTGAVSAYTNGATIVSITGGATATVTDVQTTKLKADAAATAKAGESKLHTVILDGVSGASTLTSDVLTDVRIFNSGYAGRAASDVTVNNAVDGGHALTLTVGNNAAGAKVTDATATTVTVKTEAQANSTATNASASTIGINAAKATSLTFSNAQKVTVDQGNSTLAAVATITANGAGALALGAVNTTKLTSIDASAATGAVSASIGATITGASTDHSLAVKTGSGNDVITLTGTIKGGLNPTTNAAVANTVELGAGNDSLLSNGGAIQAGATVDGGAGTDTIAASLVNAGNASLIKNFEVLDVGGLGGAAFSFDASLLGASQITGVSVSAAMVNTNVVSIANLANAATVNVTGLDAVAGTAAGKLVVTQVGAATGTADALTVNFAATSTTANKTAGLASLTTSGDETINLVSGGTAKTAADNFVANKLTLLQDTGNSIVTVAITGANDFTLGGVTQNTATPAVDPTANVAGSLKLIDGSAATGNLTITAGGSTSLLKADGTASAFNTVYTGLTIKGGAGTDNLTISAKNGVVSGGAGDDVITVGAAVSTTLTGDAGKDTFDVSLALAGTASATTAVVTTIGDLGVGDKIKFAALTGLTKTTADVASATDLTSAIDLALKNVAVTSGKAAWFAWGSDTYLVVEDAGADGFGANDLIVKLTGTLDLTNATIAANTLTIV
jgi:S-layer protein